MTNLQRQAQQFCAEKIEKQGLKLGDQIMIKPVWGKSAKIKLKRTKYQLFSKKNSLTQSYDLFLVSFANEDFALELIITDFYQQSEKNPFMLRTLNGIPFKINGQYCYQAILQKGDRIQIGHNILTCFSGAEKRESIALDVSNQALLRSDISICIEGETGTGKSYLAQKIHQESQKYGPFYQVNVSAIPVGLIESELFGHKKGAFTGAVSDKKGIMAQAKGGTLFIDEVDSLSFEMQTKLLLVLENKYFMPLGSHSVHDRINLQCRLIFASGQHLMHLVKTGKMRKDFYYRLQASFSIHLKPLRDNPELVEKLINDFCRERSVLITDELKGFYQTLIWPGNIRQLLSHLNKKVLMSPRGRLVLDENDHILLTESSDLISLLKQDQLRLREVKKIYSKHIYHQMNEDLNKASKVLDITPKTLKSLLALAS